MDFKGFFVNTIKYEPNLLAHTVYKERYVFYIIPNKLK